MPRERRVHVIDDEAKVRDALTLLLSTAQIESRCHASAEEYLASVPPRHERHRTAQAYHRYGKQLSCHYDKAATFSRKSQK
jgi:hypothetical protein